jgi:hypothetical protein
MKKVILGLALCFYCGHYGYGVETAPLQQAKCKDFLRKCSREAQQQFTDTLQQYSTLHNYEKAGILNNAGSGIDRVCEYYRFYFVLSTAKTLHTKCEEGQITDADYENTAEGIRDYMRIHSFPMASNDEQEKLEIAGSVLYTTLTLQKEEFVEIMRAVPEIVEFIMQIDTTAYIPLVYYLLHHEASYLCSFSDRDRDEAAWENDLATIQNISEYNVRRNRSEDQIKQITAINVAFNENTRRITAFCEPRLGVLQRLSQKREENLRGDTTLLGIRTFRDY